MEKPIFFFFFGGFNLKVSYGRRPIGLQASLIQLICFDNEFDEKPMRLSSYFVEIKDTISSAFFRNVVFAAVDQIAKAENEK